MRVISFLTAVALLTGASSVFAQSYTPNAALAQSASYYAADTASLESRLAQLEADMKKKEDKVDTKKKFSVEVSGRVFVDSVYFGDPHTKWEKLAPPIPAGNDPGHPGGASQVPAPGDFLGMRDARIGVAGKGFEIFDYKAELAYERANHVAITDVFLGAKNIPGLDYVRIGHYKVETGMSQITSGRNSTAMERPTAVSMFGPSRRWGAGQTYYFADDKVRWFNGVFAARQMASDNKFYTDGDTDTASGVIYNSRFTMVPYYDKGGERFFHVGGHYMYMENPTENAATMTTPNAARIGGFSRAGAAWFTPTAEGSALKGNPTYNQGGLEMAWGHGRLGINSELFAGSFGDGRDLYGGYVEARYFLTGDTRLYDKKNGALGNVKLKKNYLCAEECIQTWCHGPTKGFGVQSWGALEAFAQWGFTDSDRVAAAGGANIGGRTTDTVLGLNWYWSPSIRMMFEYVHSDGTRQRRGGGDAHTQGDSYRATEDIFATSLRFYF